MIEKDAREEKLLNIYENILDSELVYSGNVENIPFYPLFCKAAAKNQLHELFGCNSCFYNFLYHGEDSILMIFSIPINSNVGKTNKKDTVERIMEIVSELERIFITLDFVEDRHVENDKFIYLFIIKKIKETTDEG